jgi:hypothetical protein
MEENRTYSIGTVAKKVGVPKYKLRHWCDRYLPEIRKIDIGDMQHRRFTQGLSEASRPAEGALLFFG